MRAPATYAVLTYLVIILMSCASVTPFEIYESKDTSEGETAVFPESKRLEILEGVKNLEPEDIAQINRKAVSGDPDAQLIMGLAYQDGIAVNKNEAETVRWYRKAATQGHPMAQCNLACSYRYGEGVTVDNEEAAHWYIKAAEQGFWPAQYNLAYFHEHGIGVSQDIAEAERWYRRAAEQGFAPAQLGLARAIWQRGPSTMQEHPETHRNEAKYWFERASDQGSVVATYCLGEYYLTKSLYLEKSPRIAADYWEKAAVQGYPYAAFRLAEVHSTGRLASGPPEQKTGDDMSGCVWYRVARELERRGEWAQLPTKLEAARFRQELVKRLAKYRNKVGDGYNECESLAAQWLEQSEAVEKKASRLKDEASLLKGSRGCRRVESRGIRQDLRAARILRWLFKTPYNEIITITLRNGDQVHGRLRECTDNACDFDMDLEGGDRERINVSLDDIARMVVKSGHP